ncbi:two-component system response regulator [Stenotrophomonas pictorum JCM 9942]|uniref:Two-component system response regulator n=1 Tax=Stenotrophomonas pictorum JCM 9942 TaxID=1236960 RepID=A0A0R0AGP3_9GAMM|nr:response regulator transcription factor [Stenotrophomonas pictorum]KRG40516.1 two-component system response regulator [Stenotrophomonas pictorum JCM 9942]
MRLLIVEDSQALAQALGNSLTREGYICDHAQDGEQALAFLEAFDYDLVVLDWMLPKRDGISVLSEMHLRGLRAGVLMLSARDQVVDRVAALDAGVDDYLVKPFSTDELLARLRALARRPLESPPMPMLQAGELRLDPRSRRVFWRQRDLELTPKEYALLELLMRQPQQVFSRGHIFSQLYDSTSDVSDKAVEVIISTLRTKLLKAGADQRIKTRRGFGYVFE